MVARVRRRYSGRRYDDPDGRNVVASVNATFGTLAVLLAIGLVADRMARVLGMPDIPALVVAGFILGPVLGVVHLAAGSGWSGFVLNFGAAFMLYEGGRRLPLSTLRQIGLGVGLLATVGVLVTAAALTAAAHWILPLPWVEAGLVGAVLASTDPATIIPLFDEVRIRPRLAHLLEAEAGFNDAVSAILTSILVAFAAHRHVTVVQGVGTMGTVVAGGAVVGLAVGVLIAWLLPGDHRLGVLSTREQGAVLSLIGVLAAFALAGQFRGSTYMAVFVTGIVVGNRDALGVPSSFRHRIFHDTYLRQVAGLVRMLVFLVLGTAVSLKTVAGFVGPGLLLTAILIFFARPVAVLACLPLDRRTRWTWGEIRFTAWVRETGVVPAALAGLLLEQRIPGADAVAAVVFLAVMATITLQVPTTAAWARYNGVAEDRN